MERVRCLDYLKSIALIGVLLFHVGLVTNGYLGVEVFFVISGFLFAKSCKNSFQTGTFNPVSFILKKVSSFWLLIIVSSAISLVLGYFLMLPDDYENLAESVIASVFFANNILQAITTKNYWDVVNTYKPMMHLWYIGVLMQSFVFLAISIWLINRISKKDLSKYTLEAFSVVSLIIYLLPFFSASDKFYYFQFRLFEITTGALLAYVPVKTDKKRAQFSGYLGFSVIFFIMFCGLPISKVVGVLATVISTSVVVLMHSYTNEDYSLSESVSQWISLPGKYSYEAYIWHQVLIAFLYYSVYQTICPQIVFFVILGTAILPFFTVVIRKQFPFRRKSIKIIACVLAAIPVCALSFLFYLRAGVVRDVPELNIDANNVHRNMHAEYVDIPYSWNKDFTEDNKIHVLVLGNSFGRDFANILQESVVSSKLEISYYSSEVSDIQNRVQEADYVFYGTSSWAVPESLGSIPEEKLYIVGNKGYGNSNGIIYVNRGKEWYFDQTVAVSDDDLLHNNALRGVYGNHYIDMISPLLSGKNIAVFTDDHYYVSQDCRHLTKQGAQYYSRILDFDFLV